MAIKRIIDANNRDVLILSEEEIDEFNFSTKRKTASLYDVWNINYVSKRRIENLIDSFKLPVGKKYSSQKEIENDVIKSILENKNISAIKDQKKIRRGLTVKRANMKSFPTEIPFYDSLFCRYDRLQETGIPVNTPIIILHESKDKKWLFGIAPTYYGWLEKSSIACANEKDWEYFLNRDRFLVITRPEVYCGDLLLEMGSTFPFENIESDKAIMMIPTKDEKGNVKKQKVSIKVENTHVGFLPYTKKNVFKEAIKYLGFPYSWGDKDRSVDCSSFVSNVFKTLGFVFPRNTKDEEKSIGKRIDIENLTLEEKKEYIISLKPTLIYAPGHVMLFIGSLNGDIYVIHSSGSEGKVLIENISLKEDRLRMATSIIKIC